MKILVGVHCNDKNHELMSALAIREELHLLAVNMHQPALEAAALLVKVNAHELQKRGDAYANVSPWNQSAAKLEQGITNLLLAGNPNAFIDNAQTWLNNGIRSPLRNMFNGHMVYGISTEQEAQFIRDNGGLMIHIIKTENPRHISILNCDKASYYARTEDPSVNSLKTIAIIVKAHFAKLSEAEAA